MYTVGKMAKMLSIPTSTLRYYDKQGLLPFVERSPGGMRVFQASDYEWLKIIECLKKAGMPLKSIRKYIEYAIQGDETLDQRLELFQKQREVLQAQMEDLRQTMETLEFKCWYYETAKAAGTTEILQNLTAEDVPDRFKAVKERLSIIPKEPTVCKPEKNQEFT